MYTYSRNYSEKRDYLRMVMNCPVTYNEQGSDKKFVGTCINLSAKGVFITSHVHFSVGTKLEIHVKPNLAKSPTFDAVVEVVRVEQAANSRAFGLGAQVVEIVRAR
ncbi:MAG: PilZ domain-containing protein [Gammaproteobacteria bacterium]|nr:PilZ domain-containing protein [Gammaproteobacteria bacterium]